MTSWVAIFAYGLLTPPKFQSLVTSTNGYPIFIHSHPDGITVAYGKVSSLNSNWVKHTSIISQDSKAGRQKKGTRLQISGRNDHILLLSPGISITNGKMMNGWRNERKIIHLINPGVYM